MTKTPVRGEKQLSQICVRCGFCCSGLLFDYAYLEADEVGFARAIGLNVGTIPGPTGDQQKFDQPCPHLCGTSCSIYRQARPKICSGYFCQLAKKFNRGEIDGSELMEKVIEAQALMARIEPMLLPGETWPAARARWFSERNKRPRNRTDAEFQLLMTALNLFLDRNFRKEGQRILSVAE